VSGTNEILAIGAILVLLGALAGLALVRARDLHTAAAVAPYHSDPALQPTAS
jgi:hypothetical protein